MRIFPLSRPKKPSSRSSGVAGFSLLEMLIVLAIMGLVLSMVGVRMVSSLEASRFARTADAGIAKIRTLRAEALLGGTALFIIFNDGTTNDSEEYPPHLRRTLELPAGWVMSGSTIQISKTGFCSGGRVTLHGPSGRQAHYELQAPACLPKRIT